MSVLVCAFAATGALLWPAAAFAQRSRFGRGPLRRVVVVRGYWPYYDPWFWGFDPWSPFLAPYPYAFGPAGYGDEDGYESFSTEIRIRDDETTPLNVSLPAREQR